MKEITRYDDRVLPIIFRHLRYVSEHDFPGDVYPKYMSGPTYLASRQAISAIMPHTSEVIGFNMDDILYTGILAQLGNVSVLDYVDHFTFYLPVIFLYFLIPLSKNKKSIDC